MLSINTNLSSLIAQRSMGQATNILNQAIERMTTGYKINHAKDNAANYAIATNMSTKIGAYMVAEDNVSMGIDLVTTASDTINQMQNHAERLRVLATQAQNGTYGAQSLDAITSEANARITEIMRLYNTSEYNGIGLFNRKAYTIDSSLPQAGDSGFIDETAIDTKLEYNGFIADPVTYTEEQIEQMLTNNEIKALDDSVIAFTSGQKYLISNKAELKRLAELVNSGQDSTGAIFILGADIDLSGEEWTPIGNNTSRFKGSFDGNGHIIKNLKIDNPTTSDQGLFGTARYADIKNVALVECCVNGNESIGALVGYSKNSSIVNCYASGIVTGQSIYVGGLVGVNDHSIVINSFATASVEGQGRYVGGLVGINYTDSTITNSYATGKVTGQTSYAGGLTGQNYSNSTITNSYATGYVSCQGDYAGGLVGGNSSNSIITNSYATGKVAGEGSFVGGLAGTNYSGSTIIDSYATGNVSSQGLYLGGLAGVNNGSTITNTYSTGDVTGQGSYVGGLIGLICSPSYNTYTSDSVAYGNVNSTSTTSGSLIGGIVNTTDGVNFSTVSITNCQARQSDKNVIGVVLKADYTILPDYDMTDWLDEISAVGLRNISTNLQVGINGDSSSQISFDTNFDLEILAFEGGIVSANALNIIDDFINMLSEKSTLLGSVSNRLESALDEISTQYENLVSSRSTIRDADIADESSSYIQAQILQQAAATLMATANQSPAIALQLI